MEKTSLTMEKALTIFDNWAALRGLSEETIRGYTIDSRQFAKWMAQSASSPILISSITDQQIEDFMHYLIKVRKCCPATVNRKLNTLEMFFRCMKRKKFITDHPMEEIERMKVSEKEISHPAGSKKDHPGYRSSHPLLLCSNNGLFWHPHQ